MIGLKAQRTAAGMSQEALAQASGVGIRTIRRMESDSADLPNLRSAMRIAAALGTTIDDLIREVHANQSDTPASAGVKPQSSSPESAKKRAAAPVKGA